MNEKNRDWVFFVLILCTLILPPAGLAIASFGGSANLQQGGGIACLGAAAFCGLFSTEDSPNATSSNIAPLVAAMFGVWGFMLLVA